MTDYKARDQVLAGAIAGIGQLDDERLFLTGGTLLRACAFENYRYSEDLDFDWLGSKKSFIKTIRSAWPAIEALTSEYNATLEATPESIVILHEGEDGRANNKLKMDCNDYHWMHRRAYDKPYTFWPLQKRYNLDPSSRIRGITLESVAANKIACVASRSTPRDVYDLYRLSKNDSVDMDAAWALYLEIWDRYRIDKRFGPGRHTMVRWKPDPHPAYLKGSLLGSKKAIGNKWSRSMPRLLGGDLSTDSNPTCEECFTVVSEWITRKHTRYVEEYKFYNDGRSPFSEASSYNTTIVGTAKRRATHHKRQPSKTAKPRVRAKPAEDKKTPPPPVPDVSASGRCGSDLGDGQRCRNVTAGGGRCHLHRG